MSKVNNVIDDFIFHLNLETSVVGKDVIRRKKKNKKSKKRLQDESNNANSEECGSSENVNLDDVLDSKSDEDNSDEDNNEELSDVSSSSDMLNLQLDGRMKTAPTYEEEEISIKEMKAEPRDDTVPRPTIILEGHALNARVLDQYARTYELEKFEKNYLIIFNQKNINNYEPRLGTDQDVSALKDTFSKCNFECHDYHDLTKNEIIDKLKIFESENFSDYGCVAVAVLTHGNKDGWLRAKDREYSEMEIINYFKTHDKPTLITKPKLLIIQACRGIRLTPGVSTSGVSQLRMDSDMDAEHYTLPVEADMLILHSSYTGSPSIRNEVHGSWFIQTLCKKIDEFSDKFDIESILTEVKREVAIDLHFDQYNRVTNVNDTYKQMPVVTSTLIRKLYLKKINENEETQVDGPSWPDKFMYRTTSTDEQSEVSGITVSPGNCACYLSHFAYIRNCLSYFIEANPEDEVAQSFFDISSTFEDTEDFNAPKKMMAKAISNHLKFYASNYEYYKLIYMHKN